MPTAYSPIGGRSKSTLGAQQGVGDLGEDAGAVAGVRLGAGGAPVVEVVQRGEALRRRWRASGVRGRRPRRRHHRRPCRSPGRRARRRRARPRTGSAAAGAVRSDMSLPSSAAGRTSGGGAGPGAVSPGRWSRRRRRRHCGGLAPGATCVRPGAGSSPPGGDRWAVVRGATLARFRRVTTRPGSPAGLPRRVHSRNTGLTPINPMHGASAGSHRIRGRRRACENASAGVGGPVIILTGRRHRVRPARDRSGPLPASPRWITSRGRPRMRDEVGDARRGPTMIAVNTLSRTPKKCSAGSVRSSSTHSRPEAVGGDVEGEGPAVPEPEPAVGPDHEGGGSEVPQQLVEERRVEVAEHDRLAVGAERPPGRRPTRRSSAPTAGASGRRRARC